MNHLPKRIDGCALCNVQTRFNTRLSHFPTLRPGCNGPSLYMNSSDKAEIIQYIQFLGACISDLNQAIYLLHKQRQKLVLEKHTYHNLLPRMLRMPTEIHRQIFKHCVDDWVSHSVTPKQERRPRYWSIPPRRVLTQVCQSWRKTVLTSPELWCDLNVKDYLVENGGITLQNEIVLSKSLPLRIFYSTEIRGLEDIDYSVAVHSDVLELLAQTRHRWVSFTAGVYLGEFREFLIEPGTTPIFPALRHIGGDPSSYLIDEEDDTAVAENMPLLSHMDLVVGHPPSELLPLFPWSNLRHLGLDACDPHITLHFLPQVAFITWLELRFVGETWEMTESSLPNQPVLLPLVDTLKILYAYDKDNKDSFKLVSLLRLPALSQLTLSKLNNFGCVIEMLAATELLAPSQPRVQVLELQGMTLNDAQQLEEGSPTTFDSFFRLLPYLKTLSIQRFRGFACDELLRALTPNPYSVNSMLCRGLEGVSIVNGDLSPQSLQLFLLSRLEMEEKKLTRLIVDNSRLLPKISEQEDIDNLINTVQNCILPPCTRLRLDLRYKLKVDGVDKANRMYFSGIPKYR